MGAAAAAAVPSAVTSAPRSPRASSSAPRRVTMPQPGVRTPPIMARFQVNFVIPRFQDFLKKNFTTYMYVYGFFSIN